MYTTHTILLPRCSPMPNLIAIMFIVFIFGRGLIVECLVGVVDELF